MPTGISGSFDVSAGQSVTMRINYTENYDAVANTSTLTVSMRGLAANMTNTTWYLDGTISVNGTTIASFSSSQGYIRLSVAYANTWYDVTNSGSAASWTSGSIAHNTDGSKTTTVSVNFSGYIRGGTSGSELTASGSKSVTLTTIPRASTIAATDANIGAVSMIAVNKRGSSYTHSIAYSFGGLTGYVTASGGVSTSEVKFSGTSVGFTVPTSFYAKIPSAKTGVCTLTCRTYSGSAQIGSAQTCKFTATADKASCAPTVSGTVKDVNTATTALTGDANKLVRYRSTAQCAITATAKHSATIQTKTIAGVAVSGASRDIAAVESGKFTFSATDSRGYTTSATVSKTLVAYVPLTCNVSAARNGPTTGKATVSLSGNCFNGSFGAVSNTLTVSYRYRKSGGSWNSKVSVTPTRSGNTWKGSFSLTGLTYTAAWEVEVTAADKLDSVTRKVTISRGIPVFDWGQNDFQFNVPMSAAALAGRVEGQTFTNNTRIIVTPAITYSLLGLSSSVTDEVFLRDAIKQLCKWYPSEKEALFISKISPNYRGVAFTFIYDTSNLTGDEKLPTACGLAFKCVNKMFRYSVTAEGNYSFINQSS